MSREAAIWASLPVPALILDPEDRIEEINPAAEDFLNASARSILGRGIWQVILTETPLALALARARESGAPLIVNDLDIARLAQPALRCALQVAPLAGGEARMIMVITPRDLAGRLGENISVKAAARSAIGMAEMLAHEIKNPLAGITGAAQLLGMGLGPEDQELTGLIVAESRRIVKLLERVEQFGNPGPPEFAPVNLHDILDRARHSARLGFGARMRIEQDYDPSLPPALGDKDQLLQVVLNLLKNAAEAAGPEGGTIRLRSYFEHGFRLRRADGIGPPLPLQIEVVDDGPGLPEAIRDALFDPFVSGRENGTGLGLALVSKIVSEHGGWISVASQPGHTVFRISLPRAPQGAGGTGED
ncbi:nitrogen regulation protein NR(II) [Sulfitobacter aestuarii]|uniref:histidine kinase n=1 Tax=Sulfitobacter aestuarii TaxID=2161676 RepID=A0ABW5U082_9RHOB